MKRLLFLSLLLSAFCAQAANTSFVDVTNIFNAKIVTATNTLVRTNDTRALRLTNTANIFGGASLSLNGGVTPLGTIDARQPTDGSTLFYARRQAAGSGTGYFLDFKSANAGVSLFSVDTGGSLSMGNLKLSPSSQFTSLGLSTYLDAGDQATALNSDAYRFQHYITTGGTVNSFNIWLNRVNANLGGYSVLYVNSTEDAVGTSTSYLLNLLRNTNSIFNFQSGGTFSGKGPFVSTNGYISQVVTVTDNFFATSTNDVILMNADGKSVILPTAIGNTGRRFTIKQIASFTSGTIITNATGAQNIDGALFQTLGAQYKSVTVVSDGAQYWITSAF